MPNILNRLISQLDTLVPYLALSQQEVFELVKREYRAWVPESQVRTLPSKYNLYKIQIAHSGFLLGYAYFEAFLNDLFRLVLLKRPKMLPKEMEITFSEISSLKSRKAIFTYLIDKKLWSLFHKSMNKIIDYSEKNLELSWSNENREEIEKASLIRNCIMHNMGIVDNKLGSMREFKAGEKIELEIDLVHKMGIIARSQARDLYKQAKKKHKIS